MHRRGVGSSTPTDQEGQGQNRSHPVLRTARLMMCARAATAPSCSGFTIGQIRAIMGTCPPSQAQSKGIRYAPPGLRAFRSRIVSAGSQPLEADSWHDPSRGAFVFSRRSPELHPVEGGGVFFVNGRPTYHMVVGKWPPMRVNRTVMVSGSGRRDRVSCANARTKQDRPYGEAQWIVYRRQHHLVGKGQALVFA